VAGHAHVNRDDPRCGIISQTIEVIGSDDDDMFILDLRGGQGSAHGCNNAATTSTAIIKPIYIRYNGSGEHSKQGDAIHILGSSGMYMEAECIDQ
jgi:hypothetical protein